MSELDAAKGMLAEASRLVDEFTASVANGEPMDLQNFNGTIDQACQTAMSLPEADLHEIKIELVSLLDRLNAAKEDLMQVEAGGNIDQEDAAG